MQIPRFRRPTFVEFVSVFVAVAYTAAVIALVLRRCYFYGDDYSGFSITRNETFGRSLLESVGGQVVPLTRALNFAFFRAFGMRYRLAIGILCVFHAVGIVYLYRILNLFGRSRLNVVLVALYACYVHTWVQLGWWIAGLERMPFVAASAMALYHYVRHGETRARRDLVMACAGNAVALGFYSKALLLPFCMIGLDVARIPLGQLRATRLRDVRARWSAAMALFVVGLSLSLLEHKAAGELGKAFGRATVGGLVEFYKVGLTVFAHGFFGLSLALLDYHPKLWVALAWLLLVGYTSYRVPRAWVTWLVLLALLMANLGVIGISSRIDVFGTIMALEVRYFWELGFFTVLLVGFVLQRIPTTTPEARWLRRVPSMLTRGVQGAFLVGYAVVSYLNCSIRTYPDSHPMVKTTAFMVHLRADLSRNARFAPLRLVDGEIPHFIIGFDLTFLRYSQLLALMDVPVVFTPPEEADFEIARNGHLVLVDRPSPQGEEQEF